MGAQGGPQVPGAADPGEANGFDDGPDDEGAEELEAGGFDVPEPTEDAGEIEGTATMYEDRVPEPPGDPKDDDLQ
jgi:hypothetical protein